jgi:predicted DNA binding protein
MPVIPYTIRTCVCKTVRKTKRWFYEYERIFVDVSDEVAAFLEKDNRREKRYRWKIQKQMRDAGIHAIVSLDEIKSDENGDSYFVADLIEDTVNPENRNPLSILIENEFTEGLYDLYEKAMTQKQYEVLKLHERGYTTSDIAELLGIDESSARERLHNALKKVVEMYIMHSNYDILTGLQDFVFKDLQGEISATKYNDLFAAAFRMLVLLTNPQQYKLVKFVIDGDYEKKIKKYLDSLKPTPENPA